MRMLGALAVVHPLPSAINAGLVAALAIVAGADVAVAALLAIGMLGYQVSIGALNDLVDTDRDREVKPGSPIPAGLVARRSAVRIVIVGGAVGSAISAGFGAAVLAVGMAGYASGLAYDLFMRRLGWGWLCFSVAIPLLLFWTWLAAAGSLPPTWPVLLPLAALAGPALHVSNSLVDIDGDRDAGTRSLATQLGLERARLALAALVVTIYVLAWTTLTSLSAPAVLAAVTAIVATLMGALGVVLSWRPNRWAREVGWLSLAMGLALLAVAWASSVATPVGR